MNPFKKNWTEETKPGMIEARMRGDRLAAEMKAMAAMSEADMNEARLVEAVERLAALPSKTLDIQRETVGEQVFKPSFEAMLHPKGGWIPNIAALGSKMEYEYANNPIVNVTLRPWLDRQCSLSDALLACVSALVDHNKALLDLLLKKEQFTVSQQLFVPAADLPSPTAIR